MFLLVSVRHVGAHPDELQHGVSIQSSINLGKTFLRIPRIRIIPSAQILARVFVYLPPSISQILDFNCRMVLILFWSILNGVTLKTSNTVLPLPHMHVTILVDCLHHKYKLREWARISTFPLQKDSNHLCRICSPFCISFLLHDSGRRTYPSPQK